MAELSPILVITKSMPHEQEAAALRVLYEAGCRLFHLRKPQADRQYLGSLCAQLSPSLRQCCSVHADASLARALGCGGYHHPQAERTLDLRASRSWHRPTEVSAQVSYGLLSPVYASISKPGYLPRWSLRDCAIAASDWPCPVYALGGVSPGGIPALRRAGFAGAAVLGWLWQDYDLQALRQRWLDLAAAWEGAAPQGDSKFG